MISEIFSNVIWHIEFREYTKVSIGRDVIYNDYVRRKINQIINNVRISKLSKHINRSYNIRMSLAYVNIDFIALLRIIIANFLQFNQLKMHVFHIPFYNNVVSFISAFKL